MIGLDKNLLVRLLVNDDVKQAHYAEKLIENSIVFIPKSVLLETEWVLRYTYDLTPDVILKAFESLLGLPHVTVEDPACIIKVIQWYGKGLDFADAMHLASSSQMADEFATLDKKFIKKAKKLNVSLITMV